MSKTIQLLEKEDTIQRGDFMRPLRQFSDTWQDTNHYGGAPLDHFKWCPIEYQLGPVWIGETVGEYLKFVQQPAEFIRGEIPAEHILETKNFINFHE